MTYNLKSIAYHAPWILTVSHSMCVCVCVRLSAVWVFNKMLQRFCIFTYFQENFFLCRKHKLWGVSLCSILYTFMHVLSHHKKTHKMQFLLLIYTYNYNIIFNINNLTEKFLLLFLLTGCVAKISQQLSIWDTVCHMLKIKICIVNLPNLFFLLQYVKHSVVCLKIIFSAIL